MGAPMKEVEETQGASLEAGEETPLLHKGRSSDWRAPAIVLGFRCLGSIAYFGVNANLVTYFSSVFHETNAASATSAAMWSGTSFFTPLLGAIAADTYLGRYWTLLISILAFLPGMIILTLSAFLPSLRPLPCQGNLCPSATTAQNLVFSCGLYLIALGSGGIDSSSLPFGADQFYDENQIDRERKASFFTSYYICLTAGNLVASTLVVWVQVNVSWAFGYGLGTLCMVLCLGGFLLGKPLFRLVSPGGSPLRSVAQVLVASIRKMHLDVPSDGSLLYAEKDKNIVEGIHQLAHTDTFRCLDKAAIVSDSYISDGHCPNKWKLCTVTQVEELKILLRLLPIWISSAIYSTAYIQMYTTFIEQGNAMDNRIGGFSIPPPSLQAFEVICVICLAIVCNKIIIPITIGYAGNKRGLSLLHRIRVGHMLMIITMAVAAITEARRLAHARMGKPFSIAWQLPQYFILACSEVLCCIGQLEFFYDQAPETMKSMCTSLFLLSVSLASCLSSLIISFIMFLTTKGGQPGWLPDNLDVGHLDYIFWILSALCTLNFVFFLICANKYTLKKVVLGDEDICC